MRVICVFFYSMCSFSSSSSSLPPSYLHSKANYISPSFVPSLSPTFYFSSSFYIPHSSLFITSFSSIILISSPISTSSFSLLLTSLLLFSSLFLTSIILRWYKYLHFKSGSKKNLNSILHYSTLLYIYFIQFYSVNFSII